MDDVFTRLSRTEQTEPLHRSSRFCWQIIKNVSHAPTTDRNATLLPSPPLREANAGWLSEKEIIIIWPILCVYQPVRAQRGICLGGCVAVYARESRAGIFESLWGLGAEEEEGYRTGPPCYIG
jgi:hypothetical protein